MISIIISHLVFIVLVLCMVAIGFFVLVLTGLANSYGEHDQLMAWLKLKQEAIKDKVFFGKTQEVERESSYQPLLRTLTHGETAKQHIFRTLAVKSLPSSTHVSKSDYADIVLDILDAFSEETEEDLIGKKGIQFEKLVNQMREQIEKDASIEKTHYFEEPSSTSEYPINNESPKLQEVYESVY